MEQQQRLTGITLKNNFVNRGCRDVKELLETVIVIPDKSDKQITPYQKQKLRRGFKRKGSDLTQNRALKARSSLRMKLLQSN